MIDDVSEAERLRRLRALRVRYLLASRRLCPTVQGTGMRLVYEDAATRLWDVSSED